MITNSIGQTTHYFTDYDFQEWEVQNPDKRIVSVAKGSYGNCVVVYEDPTTKPTNGGAK